MARKKENEKLNPRHRAIKEKKQAKALIGGFIVTGVIIVGLVGYAVIYSVFLKDNIAVAVVDGEKIDNEYYRARVRLERNGYLQQYMLLNTQAQIYANDENQAGYFENQMMQIASDLDNTTSFGEMVLETMIEDKIIAIKGREMGLEVTDAEIDALFGQIFNYFPNGTPTPAPTIAPFTTPQLSPTQEAILQLEPTTIVDALKIEPEGGVGDIGDNEPTATTEAPTATPGPTATAFTEELFQQEYDGYIKGLENINVDEEYIRKYFFHYLMREKVKDALDAEVPSEQDQVWARHILVSTEAKAQEVLNRLENGEKWADVAEDVSLDTSNKANGGDLGWFSEGQMVEAFSETAFALEIGEISDPIETQFGWHVIQLINRAVLPLSASNLQNQQNLAFQEWLAEAKESISYEINDVYRDLTPTDPSLYQLIATQQAAFEAQPTSEITVVPTETPTE